MLSWRLARLSLQKSFSVSNIKLQNVLRTISTSEKNREATTATASGTGDSKVKSTWQSYGFGITEQSDFAHMHISFFLGVTLLMVGCSFYVAYAPTEDDWEQREAFLELRKREQLGMPLIDPNYVDPSLIELPIDEDLEIII